MPCSWLAGMCLAWTPYSDAGQTQPGWWLRLPGVIPSPRHSPSRPRSLHLSSSLRAKPWPCPARLRRAAAREGRAGAAWSARAARSPEEEGVLLLVALPAQPLADHAAVLLLRPLQLTGRKVIFPSLFLHSQRAKEEVILPVPKVGDVAGLISEVGGRGKNPSQDLWSGPVLCHCI